MRFASKFAFMVIFCALAGAKASAVQMVSFDYPNDAGAQAEWIVSGNYAGGGNSAPALTASTADKMEGSSALGVSYTYTSTPYYEAILTKTYPTPIDVSNTKRFSLQMKLSANAAADLVYVFSFRDSNGYAIRRVVWSGLPSGAWTSVDFDLTNLEEDPWNPHNPFDHPNLANIASIQISWQKSDATAGSGVAEMLLDDLQSDSFSPTVYEQVIDDFNYADNASLQAVWQAINDTPSQSSVDVVTTGVAAEGSAALGLTCNQMQTDYAYGTKRVFTSPQDFSSAQYWKLFLRGSSTGSGHFLVYLMDQNGQAMRVWIRNTDRNDPAYNSFFIGNTVAPAADPNNPSAHYSENADAADWGTASMACQVWHQWAWDAGQLVDADLTKITEIWLIPGTGGGPVSTSLAIDRLAVGLVAQSAVCDWSIY